jgi:putative hydrolase of the HAD superfamily
LNRQNKAENAQADEQRSYRWWREIFGQSVGDIIASADLNPMFDLCYHEYAKGKYWQLYPEVEETLDTLHSKGFRLVVMSNWDHRLDQTLKELELYRFFEKIYISTRIGYAKPDPKAFRHILEDLNIPANTLLHIGDTLQEDIIAAQEAGVQSILLDRRGKYAAASLPANLPRISRLSELT